MNNLVSNLFLQLVFYSFVAGFLAFLFFNYVYDYGMSESLKNGIFLTPLIFIVISFLCVDALFKKDFYLKLISSGLSFPFVMIGFLVSSGLVDNKISVLSVDVLLNLYAEKLAIALVIFVGVLLYYLKNNDEKIKIRSLWLVSGVSFSALMLAMIHYYFSLFIKKELLFQSGSFQQILFFLILPLVISVVISEIYMKRKSITCISKTL
ncbi:hypothetical protein [Acinetobacter brisouii]|uniref:hypothetical protein n=1 Tax=Acinetobacter brisouii TaxID=396323 RepID=UPI0035B083BE